MSKLGLSPGVSFFKRTGQVGFDLEGIGGVRGLGMVDFIRFLREDCKVKPVDMVKIQIHAVSPYAFLGLPTQEKVEELWGRIKDGIAWTGKGDVQPFLCLDSYTEVKLKGLIPGTEEEVVATTMGYYGEVISCKEYRVKIGGVGGSEGAASGDYLLKMKIKENIPRLIPEPNDGEVWVCYYDGQEDSCWRCLEPGHMTRECRAPNATRGFLQEQRVNRKAHLQDAVDESMIEEQHSQQQQGGDEQVSVLARQVRDDQSGKEGEQGGEGEVGEVEVGSAVEGVVQVHVVPATPESQDLFAPTPDPELHIATGQTEEIYALEQSLDPEFHIATGNTQEIVDALEQGPAPKLSKSQKKIQKKEKQRDKRNRSQSRSPNVKNQSPKRSKPIGSLQPVNLGEQSDRRRSSCGNLDAVPRPKIMPEDRIKIVARSTNEIRLPH